MILIHFVVVLGILIFVHELGHFIVAKLSGVRVEKFSLGFGPKLVGKQIGETEYLVSAFPLGGYVKMFGEGGAIEGETTQPSGETERNYDEESGELLDESLRLTEAEKARSFAHKPSWQRLAIVAAGPIFNLLFAWLVVVLLFMISYPILSPRVKPLENRPAARAGLASNDLITSINGTDIIEWDDIAPVIARSTGIISVNVNRGGTTQTLKIVPESGSTRNLFGETVKQPVIGIAPTGEFKNVSFSPHRAVIIGTIKTGNLITLTFKSLIKLAQGIVPLKSVGGPLQIADLANQAAKQGSPNFFLLLALISINLGILNLLPIPILDGGHIIFCISEVITRRPVNQKVREYAQQIGLFLLLSLMVLAFYNDIIRYFVGPG